MNEDLCPRCNKQKPILEITPSLVHYGKLTCPECGFIGWARNPNSPKIGTTGELRVGKKSIDKVKKFHNFEKEFCFFCLRKKEQLGEKETLTIDHIQELSEGGVDEVHNMQILCSACHKLKNWTRLYLNWHLREKNKRDIEDDTTNTSE